MALFLLLFACIAAVCVGRGFLKVVFGLDPSSDYYLAAVFGVATGLGLLIAS